MTACDKIRRAKALAYGKSGAPDPCNVIAKLPVGPSEILLSPSSSKARASANHPTLTKLSITRFSPSLLEVDLQLIALDQRRSRRSRTSGGRRAGRLSRSLRPLLPRLIAARAALHHAGGLAREGAALPFAAVRDRAARAFRRAFPPRAASRGRGQSPRATSAKGSARSDQLACQRLAPPVIVVSLSMCAGGQLADEARGDRARGPLAVDAAVGGVEDEGAAAARG